MDIYQYIENDRHKKIKIFGLTVYRQGWRDIDNMVFVEKKYLKGLYRTIENGSQLRTYFMGIRLSKVLKPQNYDEQLKKITNTQNRIITEINRKNDVVYLHSQVFPQFKGINKDKEVVIIGTGPSLADYQPIKGAINIGCNRAFQYDKVHFDYLFSTDWNGVKTYIDQLDNYENCKKFYGTVLDAKEFIAFPQYGLNKADYNFYCNLKLDKLSPNLETNPLLSSASIAVCALHFALYTHPKKIYIVGLDTNRNGNFDKSKPQGTPMAVDMVIKGYEQIKKFADIHYPDVEITSINPVGLRGIFNDHYQNKQPITLPFEHKFTDLNNTNIDIKGLSYVQKDHRWSSKDEVEINFTVEKRMDLNIEFNLEAWLKLLKMIEFLDVEIYANNKKVKELRYSESYPKHDINFTISKKDIDSTRNINIKFKFKNMTPPQAFRLNSDYRLLGLMFKEMFVDKK